MAKQTLEVLSGTFSIHSLPVDAQIPPDVLQAPLYFIGKTHDELSIVVPDSVQVDAEESDTGWKVMEVLGPLQLSMVGIMARIGEVLSAAKVSIFVVSTFETDYFLVQLKDLQRATRALKQDGYKVIS